MSNLTQSKRSATSEIGRIALALVVVAAAYLVRLWLLQQFGFSLSIYLTYLTVIVLDALLLGLWPGLAATAATALLMDYTAIPPTNSFGIKRSGDFAALLLSVMLCAGFCVLAERFRRSQHRAGKLEGAQALNEARARFQAAIESSAEAMFLCDTQGNVIEFNQAFAAFHKVADKSEYPRKLADFANIIEVCYPDGSPVPPEQWASSRALSGEQATGVEYLNRRKDHRRDVDWQFQLCANPRRRRKDCGLHGECARHHRAQAGRGGVAAQ